MSSARSADALDVSSASSTKRPTFSRFSASLPITRSASPTRSRITRSWSARIAKHARRLAERRHAAADRLVEVLGTPGESGAELVQDEPEALGVRAPHRVLHEVGRDRRGRALDGDPAAVFDLARPSCRGRSRGSTRRAATAVASRSACPRAASRSPCSSISISIERLERLLVQLDVDDRARVHAGDADVAAEHHPERVVELDHVAARVAAFASAAGSGQRRRRPRRPRSRRRRMRSASFAHRHLGRIAVEVLGRPPRHRAVAAVALDRARAAVVLAAHEQRRRACRRARPATAARARRS